MPKEALTRPERLVVGGILKSLLVGRQRPNNIWDLRHQTINNRVRILRMASEIPGTAVEAVLILTCFFSVFSMKSYLYHR